MDELDEITDHVTNNTIMIKSNVAERHVVVDLNAHITNHDQALQRLVEGVADVLAGQLVVHLVGQGFKHNVSLRRGRPVLQGEPEEGEIVERDESRQHTARKVSDTLAGHGGPGLGKSQAFVPVLRREESGDSQLSVKSTTVQLRSSRLVHL